MLLLEWCQDWYAVRPGGTRTAVFFSGFCFGHFRSLSRNRGPQSPLPLTQLASLNPLENIPQEVVGLNQTEKKSGEFNLYSGWSQGFCLADLSSATTWTLSTTKNKKKEGRKKVKKRGEWDRKEEKEES